MPSISPVRLYRIDQSSAHAEERPDLLATEEPLEIRLGHGPATDRQQRSVSVTMRTPGNDFELALGFLFTEGIVQDRSQVHTIRYCVDLGRQEATDNIVRVELKPEVVVNLSGLERNFYMTSSCGVCGKASIEAIHTTGCPVLPATTPPIDPALIHTLPGVLRDAQRVFAYTGGLHAAGLFDHAGQLLLLREDVGRHNALDKLIGAALNESTLHDRHAGHIVLVSGRLSFELVQKTLMAGIPVLVAVGAPSSLAVSTAAEFGMTLIGFARDGRYNVYSGPERIAMSVSEPAQSAQ